MTLKEFIKEHKEELVSLIQDTCGNLNKIDDNEIRLWILNDEGLYRWAKSENVKGI